MVDSNDTYVKVSEDGVLQFLGKSPLTPLEDTSAVELGSPLSFNGGGGGSGFEPTEEQLAAMNSGITATKVATYDNLNGVTSPTASDLGKVLTAAGENLYGWASLPSYKEVPAVGPEDNGKILTASYTSGSSGTYSWETLSSGGDVKFTRIPTQLTSYDQLNSDDYSEGLFVVFSSLIFSSGGDVLIFCTTSGSNRYQYLVDVRSRRSVTRKRILGTWITTNALVPILPATSNPYNARFTAQTITGATISNVSGGFSNFSGLGDESILRQLCAVNISFEVDNIAALNGQLLGYVGRIKPTSPSQNYRTTLTMTSYGTNSSHTGVCFVREDGGLVAGYNSFGSDTKVIITGMYLVEANV